MAIEQLNAEVAVKRLETVVRAAESVCGDQGEMIAVFIASIATTCAAAPCCGDRMIAIAIETLTKARATLPEAQAAMKRARELAAAGAS